MILKYSLERHEALKKELVGKTPDECAKLVEKYLTETASILESWNSRNSFVLRHSHASSKNATD